MQFESAAAKFSKSSLVWTALRATRNLKQRQERKVKDVGMEKYIIKGRKASTSITQNYSSQCTSGRPQWLDSLFLG